MFVLTSKMCCIFFLGGVPDASKKRPINWRSKQQPQQEAMGSEASGDEVSL